MADPDYPDDIQFAGLVEAATAAADEQTGFPSTLGKRKRDNIGTDDAPILNAHLLNDAPDPTAAPHTPQPDSSASVLFREASSKSRKYSRPPLGKVFTSLELAPENFLRLQIAAKAFMLDDAHPERKEVVGQKQIRGGSDVAKLNLWSCVDEFLAMHGYGDLFFAPGAGDSIPGAPQRSLFWPRDRQAIIKLMMPLMRKMVTNERQRVYAAAVRKQGPTKDGAEDQASMVADESSLLHDEFADTSYADQQENARSPVPVQRENAMRALDSSPSGATFKQSIVLYVNVVSNTAGALRRVIPRFQLRPESAPSLSTLVAEVNKRYKPAPGKAPSAKESSPVVRVWLTDGLVTIEEDGEWMVALLSAGVVDWMDGEVRVLVEV